MMDFGNHLRLTNKRNKAIEFMSDRHGTLHAIAAHGEPKLPWQMSYVRPNPTIGGKHQSIETIKEDISF